jgi:HSP20 family protein
MEQMMAEMRRSMFAGSAERQGRLPMSTAKRSAMTEGRSRCSGTLVSVETDDKGYVVLADMPSFERPDIDLRFDDGGSPSTRPTRWRTSPSTARSRDCARCTRRSASPGRYWTTRSPRPTGTASRNPDVVLEIHMPILDADEEDADEDATLSKSSESVSELSIMFC